MCWILKWADARLSYKIDGAYLQQLGSFVRMLHGLFWK